VYEKYAENGKLTNAQMSKYNRLRRLERQLTEDIRPTVVKNNRLIDKLSQVSYEEGFYRHAWAIEQEARVAVAWGLLNPDAVRAAVENPLRELAQRELWKNSVTRIRRTIAQGLIQGLSYEKMARQIRKSVVDATMYDAMRVVRTEGGRAYTLGTQRSYDKAHEEGVRLKRFWDATLDDRTRPRHAALDGMEARNQGTDEDPDFVYDVPGMGVVKGPKLSGEPSFDINCRCTEASEVEGYSREVKSELNKGLAPRGTFREWAKANGVKANRFGQKYDFTR